MENYGRRNCLKEQSTRLETRLKACTTMPVFCLSSACGMPSKNPGTQTSSRKIPLPERVPSDQVLLSYSCSSYYFKK